MKTHPGSQPTPPGSAGWIVGQSIATELDIALTAMSGGLRIGALTSELATLIAAATDDWLAEGAALLGEIKGWVSIVSQLAGLAGALADDDYSRTTLAIRDMTAADALANLAPAAAAYGLSASGEQPPAASLVDLATRLAQECYQQAGLEPTDELAHFRTIRESYGRGVRFLRDGDLSSRFWHWLDRFYYEIYRPWRATRADVLAMMEQHAVTMLGARERLAAPPTDWLPPQNQLRLRPELQAAVQAGTFRVFFWVEPFGIADLMDLQPGLLLISFAAPGPIYQNFHQFASDLAVRMQALADPTRLIILRLIRNFGMTSTEMAEFMEIARPTASIHAKNLREAGLILSRQTGREVRHEIVAGEVRRLFADLERFLDLPDDAGGDS